jgi:hypothetical protein
MSTTAPHDENVLGRGRKNALDFEISTGPP